MEPFNEIFLLYIHHSLACLASSVPNNLELLAITQLSRRGGLDRSLDRVHDDTDIFVQALAAGAFGPSLAWPRSCDIIIVKREVDETIWPGHK